MSKYTRAYTVYINYLFSLFGKNLGKTALFKGSEMSGYISFFGVSDMTDIKLFYSKNLRKSRLGCPKCPRDLVNGLKDIVHTFLFKVSIIQPRTKKYGLRLLRVIVSKNSF